MQIAEFNDLILSPLPIMIILSGLFFIIPLIIYLIRPKFTSFTSYFFTYAMLIVLISYPDSWFLYILFYFVFFIPPIIQMEQFYGEKHHKGIIIVKYFTKLLQLYFAVGVVLHYVLLGFDPLTPTLIIIVYGLFLYLHVEYLKKNFNDSQKTT